MKNDLKNSKGITLISLITTILILVIITATIAINLNTSLQISNLTRLQNDIQSLNDRVATYYLAHDELPVTEDTYTKTQVEKIVKEVSPNDGDIYYTIDLSKIDNTTLNFGQDYSSSSDEKYIINESSHKIYFLHGVTYAGVTYYTIEDEEDKALVSYLPELPNKYQRVTYIESTGTQYIDTGYYINKDTSIYADFQFTDLTAQQRLFGVDTGDSGNSNVSYSFYINGSSAWAYSFIDGSGNWITTNKAADKIRHTMNFNFNGKVKIDDEAFYNQNISGSITETATTSLPIMAKNNGKGIMRYAKVKIYAFQIYNSNVLERNFIPCYRKSDKVAGLFDAVEGTFYPNTGTGTFVIGENKY